MFGDLYVNLWCVTVLAHGLQSETTSQQIGTTRRQKFRLFGTHVSYLASPTVHKKPLTIMMCFEGALPLLSYDVVYI